MNKEPIPDPLLKGKWRGNCERTSCQKPDAVWYNYSTKKFYCKSCAKAINLANHDDSMKLYGHELCIPYSTESSNPTNHHPI